MSCLCKLENPHMQNVACARSKKCMCSVPSVPNMLLAHATLCVKQAYFGNRKFFRARFTKFSVWKIRRLNVSCTTLCYPLKGKFPIFINFSSLFLLGSLLMETYFYINNYFKVRFYFYCTYPVVRNEMSVWSVCITFTELIPQRSTPNPQKVQNKCRCVEEGRKERFIKPLVVKYVL